MEIIPPRRPGKLGAFNVGPGVQGPSGGFSIDSSSRAPSSQRPVSPASVSEQVSLQQSSSARASTIVTPQAGKADVFSAPAVVNVQSYSPPPSTPAITKPYRQQNEDVRVSLLARQIPQTRDQVIQKVLANDAGIAVATPGSPQPIIPANPPAGPQPFIPPPPPKMTPAVVKTASRAMGAEVGAKVASQVASANALAAARARENLAAVKRKLDLAKMSAQAALSDAKAKAEALAKARQDAIRILNSQTSSPDAKAEAESDLRTASEAQSLADKQAREATAQVDKIEAAQQQTAAQAQQLDEAAKAANEAAAKKAAEAAEAQSTALAVQSSAGGGAVATSGEGVQVVSPIVPDSRQPIDVQKTIAYLKSATDADIAGLLKALAAATGFVDSLGRQIQAHEIVRAAAFIRDEAAARGISGQSAVVVSPTMILIGLGVLAAIMYATRKSSGLAGHDSTPLIVELDED